MAKFDLNIHQEEILWAKDKFPQLEFTQEKDGQLELSGDFKFNALAEEGGSLIINPLLEELDLGFQIIDSYKVKMMFVPGKSSDLPQVYETNSRIANLAKSRGTPISDFHVGENGLCCLCMKFEEEEKFDNGFTLKEFLHRLVIPFFYAQSYFEKKKDWPWGDFSHDIFGISEWLYERRDTLSKEDWDEVINYLKQNGGLQKLKNILTQPSKIRLDSACLVCKSEKKFKDCPHKKTLISLWQLRGKI